MKIPIEVLTKLIEKSGCDKLPFICILRLVVMLEEYYESQSKLL